MKFCHFYFYALLSITTISFSMEKKVTSKTSSVNPQRNNHSRSFTEQQKRDLALQYIIEGAEHEKAMANLRDQQRESISSKSSSPKSSPTSSERKSFLSMLESFGLVASN